MKPSRQTKSCVPAASTPQSSVFAVERSEEPARHSLLHHCKNRQILKTSVKTALVVGTTLGLINHFNGILQLSLTRGEIFQILITFLVPFSVATYSAARHLQHLESVNTRPETSTDWTLDPGQKTINQGIPGDTSSVIRTEP